MFELAKTIGAEESDLFDVWAYIAFSAPTLTRAERAAHCEGHILSAYDERMHEFLRFVVGHYVAEDAGEFGNEKLEALIELQFGTPHYAVAELGPINEIRDTFVGFQEYLYDLENAA